jgi:hypothetical protein
MRVVLDGVRAWRHELGTCLHSCAATVLAAAGLDPLATLGARWGFHYRPSDVRREEYYQPCPPGVSLVAALAPYAPVRSRWHRPADADQAWHQVREQILAGRPAVVAVDNFELPFRPAYQDVHTNHLVVVYGFDDEEAVCWVNDVVPPAFDGRLDRRYLDAARASRNPALHERDMFFTDNPIGDRWLEIEVDRSGPWPSLDDRATVRSALLTNLRDLLEPVRETAEAHEGLAGIAEFLTGAADRLAGGEDVTDEVFILAGALTASTAMHASYLRAAAASLRVPALAEAGRAVDRVAHHWTATRILVATIDAAGPDPATPADRLYRRAERLVADQRQALAAIERAVGELSERSGR